MGAYDGASPPNLSTLSTPAQGTTLAGFVSPDIYAWDFEGATDEAASGNFAAGGPFIPNSEWVRDGSIFISGAQSVRRDYPETQFSMGTIQTGNPTTIVITGSGALWSGTTIVTIAGVSGNTPSINGDHTATRVDNNTFTIPVNTTVAGSGGTAKLPNFGNIGPAFYFNVSPTQKNLYIAWWERKAPGFNGGDVRKILRFNSPSYAGPWGSFLEGGAGARYDFFWDHIATTDLANVNLPIPTPASLVGEWHHFEVHRDVTNQQAARLEIWIDGVQYFDITRDVSGGAGVTDSGQLQLMSIFNSMNGASSLNVDSMSISTARIGVR